MVWIFHRPSLEAHRHKQKINKWVLLMCVSGDLDDVALAAVIGKEVSLFGKDILRTDMWCAMRPLHAGEDRWEFWREARSLNGMTANYSSTLRWNALVHETKQFTNSTTMDTLEISLPVSFLVQIVLEHSAMVLQDSCPLEIAVRFAPSEKNKRMDDQKIALHFGGKGERCSEIRASVALDDVVRPQTLPKEAFELWSQLARAQASWTVSINHSLFFKSWLTKRARLLLPVFQGQPLPFIVLDCSQKLNDGSSVCAFALCGTGLNEKHIARY